MHNFIKRSLLKKAELMSTSSTLKNCVKHHCQEFLPKFDGIKNWNIKVEEKCGVWTKKFSINKRKVSIINMHVFHKREIGLT